MDGLDNDCDAARLVGYRVSKRGGWIAREELVLSRGSSLFAVRIEEACYGAIKGEKGVEGRWAIRVGRVENDWLVRYSSNGDSTRMIAN